MERLYFSVYWSCVILFASSLLIEHAVAYFYFHRLCKFCEVKSSNCTNTGICSSNCNITSICEERDHICIAVWQTHRNITTVETVCHDPLLPFHGIMLDDYNSTECVMKQHKALGPNFYMCSCREEECNDELIFTPLVAVSPKDVDIPVILVTLTFIVALAVVISIFCCFYKIQLKRNCDSKSPTYIHSDTQEIISNEECCSQAACYA